MAEKGWNSEECDPLGDIERMITAHKASTNQKFVTVSIRQKPFDMLKSATGLKTAKEIEQKYFELYNEDIKIKIC